MKNVVVLWFLLVVLLPIKLILKRIAPRYGALLTIWVLSFQPDGGDMVPSQRCIFDSMRIKP